MSKEGILDELIGDLQEFNDNHFDLEESIEESKTILAVYMLENKLSNCNYDSDIWFLEHVLLAKKISINFKKLSNLIQFNSHIDSKQFIDVAKCWVSSLIDGGYSIGVIQNFYLSFLKFLTLTKGLTLSNEEQFIDEFKSVPSHTRKSICTSSLNFLDYYSDSEIEHYIALLHSINPQSERSNSRILPPSKDILIFAKVLEDYFSKELSEQQFFRWFPVWLWWNLTTVIPMRPSEYCTIKRNCLSIENGNFYLKLPRYKQKSNKKRIQIMDTMKISQELYSKIEKYQILTERFGRTDTLISYKSIPSHQNLKQVYIKNKLNPNKFTLPIFRDLLESFYSYIVLGEYNVSFPAISEEASQVKGLSITRKLRAGDTRHLAFINLHRQGYHAIEIARIGGHTNISSQSHYFNHIESLVDLEILELIQKKDLASYTNKIINNETIQEYSIDKDFIERFILKPTKTNFKRKMIDGYCTYELQLCPVSDCWECTEWWRISQEEFIEKQHILAQKVHSSKYEIENIIDNLKNLYRGIYTYKKEEFFSGQELQKELIGLSKRMDNTIRKYVSLIKINERIIQNAEER